MIPATYGKGDRSPREITEELVLLLLHENYLRVFFSGRYLLRVRGVCLRMNRIPTRLSFNDHIFTLREIVERGQIFRKLTVSIFAG